MKKLLLITFFFGVVNLLFANDFPEYSILNIDSTLVENAHTIVRKELIEFKVTNASKAVERHHKVVTILNKQSYMDYFTIYYDDYNKIKKVYCVVYDAMGMEIKRYNKKDMTDQGAVNNFSLYTDSRICYLNLRQFDYPFTVECYYELTHEQGFQAYPRWAQAYGESVEQLDVKCILPANFEVQSKVLNTTMKTSTYPDGKNTVHHWELNDLMAQENEALSPPKHDILPMLMITPTTFEIDGYKGSYASWEKLGDFVHQINKERDELSPEMTQKIKDLTKGLSTDHEKISAIYDYLKKNHRYVNVSIGIGGWQTYDANYVEQNKYGDCKALSNYMKSMLKVAGIQSNLVLISSGRDRPIAEDFPISYFNHMILYVPSEDMWLECTSQSYPPGYQGSSNENRKVLVVAETDSKLVQLPSIETNRTINQSLITISEKGEAILKNTKHAMGKAHERLRAYDTYYSSQDDIEEAYRKRSDLPSFSINQFDIEVSETAPEATHKVEFEIPKYASKAGKRIFLPMNRLDVFTDLLPEDEDRQQPIIRKRTYENNLQSTIIFPESYIVESMPKSEIITTDYGNYILTIETKDNTIILKRALLIKALDLPASAYEEIRSFYSDIAKLENAKVVLKRKE